MEDDVAVLQNALDQQYNEENQEIEKLKKENMKVKEQMVELRKAMKDYQEK